MKWGELFLISVKEAVSEYFRPISWAINQLYQCCKNIRKNKKKKGLEEWNLKMSSHRKK